MAVKRIVADIGTHDVAGVQAFYKDLFDLTPVMDQGWIATLANGHTAPVQISIASEGGSGAPTPNLTIEVDNVDAVHAKAQSQGHGILYPLTDEPWGVRRFFLADPAGSIINVMMHIGETPIIPSS